VEGRAVLGGLTAIRRRLDWLVATVREVKTETPRAKTLVLDVDGWSGHLPGQHADIRLTADDGYQAQRSYSIATPADGDTVELTVERIDDGEVSPYLTEEARAGDQFELRGPIGGYFVWNGSSDAPLLLVAGGSGLVPLMAMLRHHRALGSRADARLLLSSGTIDDVLYRSELETLGDVRITLTRQPVPDGWGGFSGRIDEDMLAAVGPAPSAQPGVYVCGPTSFVESAAELLVGLGHDPGRIHTERFGPTGG
jgi:ferredoxin-NADP reductase